MATGYVFGSQDWENTIFGFKNDRGEIDIIISDSVFKKNGDAFKKIYSLVAEALEQYILELKAVSESIIVSGETHNALEEFILLFTDIGLKINDIGKQYKNLCTGFIDAIDKIDKEMYEPGCDPRDFSDDRMRYFRGQINDAKGHIFDGLENFINNTWENLKQLGMSLGMKLGGDDTSKLARSVIMDKLNYDIDDINGIQKRVIAEDVIYADKFATLYDEFNEIMTVIKKANNIVAGNSEFTYQSINSIRNELTNIKISSFKKEDQRPVITAEEADAFCSEESNLTYYEEYSDILVEARNDIGIGDALMVGISSAANEGKAILDRYKVPEEVHINDTYKYLLLKESLAETVSKVADNEFDIDAYLKEESKMKEVLGKLQDLDNDNPNDFYGSLMDAVDKAAKANGYVGDILEIVLPVMWQYEKNVEVISALGNGVDPNSLTGLAVRDLLAEYQNTALLAIDGVVDTIMDKVVKMGESAVKGAVYSCLGTAAGGLKLAEFAAEKAVELSGVGQIGSSLYEFDCLKEMNSELEAAYKHNFKVVASGDYTDADVTNLNNSFSMLQDNYKKQYDLLADAAGAKGDHDHKRYYQYLSDLIEDTNMADVGKTKPMSYEAYLKAQ